ncbi:response regulator transcription factor [Litoribrevibacter euphylliae]|uniref:Response regulator transcription factor n=1 Tax=Litoribrevibacter euphylliae TaxID=1834034 RepID=A0ABV7HJ84_9GAMM
MSISRFPLGSKSQSPYYGKTILVVDDSEISRVMLKTMIEAISGSLDVYEAKDGLEAIKMVEQHKPDLITLDEEMPGKNGLETVPELLKINPESRIVLITAHGEENVKEKVKALSIEYLAKPITEAKVINLLS